MHKTVTNLVLTKPLLTIVRFLLAESEVNKIMITLSYSTERDHMLAHVLEVGSRVLVSTRTETLDNISEFRLRYPIKRS